MVNYTYNAWGEHKVLNPDGTENTAADFIGNLNPFRYRSYYYDTETGLYYLKTRYYDPETGRFLNADDISYLDPHTVNGLNLYAYCGNNPVMRIDPNGTAWWEWLLLGFAAIVAVTAIVVGTMLTGGVAGFGFIGLVGSALSGAGIGFLGAAATSIITQGISTNWNFSQISPLAALKSGGIGAIIGGVSGIVSYGLGAIGGTYGNFAGLSLSNMNLHGHNIARVFTDLGGTEMFTSLFSSIGRFTGAVFGGVLANNEMNKIYGYNNDWEQNLKDSVSGEIQGVILNWIYKIFKWIRM